MQVCYFVKTGTNSSASIALSCHQWRFYKSFLEEMEINIPNLKECQIWKFNLHPIIGNHVFISSYHNTIEAITKILIYWKAENAAIFIDNYAGRFILFTYINVKLNILAFIFT